MEEEDNDSSAGLAAVVNDTTVVRTPQLPHDATTCEVGPYLVEVDNNGCEHCGADKTWTVVGPDGVAEGQSWMNPDDAESFAVALNNAFSLGAATERQATLADDDDSYLWERCYACGHRLAYASDSCPQCGIHFKDGDDPPNWPETCVCDRCAEARNAEEPSQ